MTTTSAPAGCARCAAILNPRFRFCPECGFPVAGDSVLSTEIEGLRHRVEAERALEPAASWNRYLLPTIAAALIAFVVVLGLLLFNRDFLNVVLPPATPDLATAQVVKPTRWEPQWMPIPPGTLSYGDPSEGRRGEIPYKYWMSKYEVPNALWFEYLQMEGQRLRNSNLWYESFPREVEGWSRDAAQTAVLAQERAQYPVRNVSPVAIDAFCEWLTRRLNSPGWEIRMPTRFEWEHAARGTDDRRYSWGNDDVLLPVPKAGVGETRTRAGIKSSTHPVDDAQLAADDRSPFGVVAMGTNVSEWTIMPQPILIIGHGETDVEYPELWRIFSSERNPVEERELKVAWRGASYSCSIEDARKFARTSFQTPSDPHDLRLDVGIRLVKWKPAFR